MIEQLFFALGILLIGLCGLAVIFEHGISVFSVSLAVLFSAFVGSAIYGIIK